MKQILMAVAGVLLFATSVWAQSVNINTADAETLTQLSGVGSVIAERIIVEREDGGDFSSAEEVAERVDGLGDTFVEENEDRLEF
jgi:competence protein ComEA